MINNQELEANDEAELDESEETGEEASATKDELLTKFINLRTRIPCEL